MAGSADPHILTGGDLSLTILRAFVRGASLRIELADTARARVRACRGFVERLVADERVVYGITTGFGRLKNIRIAAEHAGELQHNLIRSHATGLGAPIPPIEARVMLLLRINALAQGYSGVTEALLETLVTLFNAGVAPEVPRKGSVGASGDLAPLAHLSLILLGEGQARIVAPDGTVSERLSGQAVLERLGLAPVALSAKEGLALINGTQYQTALGVVLLTDGLDLLTLADIAAAMSLEALEGSIMPFSPLVARLRPHHGQAAVAANVTKLLAGSEILQSHEFCDRVQDAYSLRCVPQVHGAVRDALAHAEQVFAIEINAVTDNPLIFVDHGTVISAGNFHGEPLALALDHLGIALTILGGIAERRIEDLVNPDLSRGLPAFLTPDGGLNSGLMISQVVAAALTSENKVLAHPASVDSIPTSANQEDYVSMGPTAGLKAKEILDNVANVLAIELLAGAQALEFRKPRQPGRGVRAAYAAIRAVVEPLQRDRVLSEDIQKVRQLVDSRAIQQAAEAAVGPLA